MGRVDPGRQQRFASTSAPHARLRPVGRNHQGGSGSLRRESWRPSLWGYESSLYRSVCRVCLGFCGMVSKKPSSATHIQSASVPVVAVTAWQALFDHAQLKAGQSVLIHGAAGNVGAYAVQFAHRAGLHIIATAATDDIPSFETSGQIQPSISGPVALKKRCGRLTRLSTWLAAKSQERSFQVLRRGGKLVSAVSDRIRVLRRVTASKPHSSW